MKKEINYAYTICIIGTFLFGWSAFQYPSLANYNIVIYFTLIISSINLYIQKYSSSEITKNKDNHTLDLCILFIEGKDELRAKFLLPFILFGVIQDVYKFENNLLTRNDFTFKLEMDIGISTLSYYMMIYLLKKCVTSDLNKKTYLKERSVFRYKPLFPSLI